MPRHAAPGVDAGKGHFFVGVKKFADGRIDAVAGHHDVGPHGRSLRACAGVYKMNRGTALVLLHANAAVAGMDVLRPQLGQSFFKQDAVQLAAVDAQLGQRVTRMPAARLAVDELAIAVEKHAFEVLYAHGFELVLHAQGGQLAHGVGQQGNADTELLDLGHGLINVAVQALALECERKAESGDTTPYHGDVDAFLVVQGMLRSKPLAYTQSRTFSPKAPGRDRVKTLNQSAVMPLRLMTDPQRL